MNQAIFNKIKVFDDLKIEMEYAEPFDIILNPAVFEFKREFEKRKTGCPNWSAFSLF
jgi:hypothetical protein